MTKTGRREQVKNSKLSVELVCVGSVRLTCWLLRFGLQKHPGVGSVKEGTLMSNYLLRCGLD